MERPVTVNAEVFTWADYPLLHLPPGVWKQSGDDILDDYKKGDVSPAAELGRYNQDSLCSKMETLP